MGKLKARCNGGNFNPENPIHSLFSWYIIFQHKRTRENDPMKTNYTMI